jgi:hypothetical protein
MHDSTPSIISSIVCPSTRSNKISIWHHRIIIFKRTMQQLHAIHNCHSEKKKLSLPKPDKHGHASYSQPHVIQPKPIDITTWAELKKNNTKNTQ